MRKLQPAVGCFIDCHGSTGLMRFGKWTDVDFYEEMYLISDGLADVRMQNSWQVCLPVLSH